MKKVDAVFGALADPTRRGILRLVSEAAPVTATTIAERLPITRQAVVKHLGVLERASLVAAERVGRETHWTPTLGPLAYVDAWIDDVGSRWDARLDRLSDVVTERRASRRV
jgi:DNA-binding transcriptional ArsR family regulator